MFALFFRPVERNSPFFVLVSAKEDAPWLHVATHNLLPDFVLFDTGKTFSVVIAISGAHWTTNEVFVSLVGLAIKIALPVDLM